MVIPSFCEERFTAEAPSSQRAENFLTKNSLLRALCGREKKSVYASRASARTGCVIGNSSYLAVRPELGRRATAIFSHDLRLRGAISESCLRQEFEDAS